MIKKTMKDINFNNKKVLVRVDFNVPMQNNEISNIYKIEAIIPTIKYLIKNNAKIILLSHLGKIKTENDLIKYNMKPIAQILENKINHKVTFLNDFEGKNIETYINQMSKKDIILLQNTRFANIISNNQYIVKNRENKQDLILSQYWAKLGDVFVNDAFGVAHRKHASNVGIALNIKESCLGLLIEKEITILSKIINNPIKPFIAIIGGAKISDKINIIKNLLIKADKILIGGGMAYTFLAAQGYKTGKSIIETEKINLAKKILKKANGKIILPLDALEAKEFSDIPYKITNSPNINNEYMGLDIGPKTIQLFCQHLLYAKTIIWNGPLGVFEFENYKFGTIAICEFISNLKTTFTVIGGGDSAAAAIKLGYKDKFTHISTGGGASLKYIETSILPGIEVIQNKKL